MRVNISEIPSHHHPAIISESISQKYNYSIIQPLFLELITQKYHHTIILPLSLNVNNPEIPSHYHPAIPQGGPANVSATVKVFSSKEALHHVLSICPLGCRTTDLMFLHGDSKDLNPLSLQTDNIYHARSTTSQNAHTLLSLKSCCSVVLLFCIVMYRIRKIS